MTKHFPDEAPQNRGWTEQEVERAAKNERRMKSLEGIVGYDGSLPTRDWLGREVRQAWILWARTQDPRTAKPSWFVPYDQLSEADKEADRQIGERLLGTFGDLLSASGVLERAALSTLPAPHVEADGWRPIETAPKDGTWFVALQDGLTYPCEWITDESDEGPYHEGWWDHFNRSYEEPTQWMPVGSAPRVEDGAVERYRAALTPSAETKRAYIGEFRFIFTILDEGGEEVVFTPNVPWTTIKEIMTAINSYAQSLPAPQMETKDHE
jgi:hypothetical protein